MWWLPIQYTRNIKTALPRCPEYSNENACAWVLADRKRVQYVSCSPSLRVAGFFLKTGTEVPVKSVLGRIMAGAGNVTAGVAEVVPAYIWINSDCNGIEEFSEAAVLSSAYSQGLALLSAEDAPARDHQHTEKAIDEDDLLAELDGILKFPSRRRRR